MTFKFRQQIRAGKFRGPTAGFCGGFAQANLAILPKEFADDFGRFCAINPQACPLLAFGEPGSWHVPKLRGNLDVCTWRDDLVVFAIGCSFSFEEMPGREGIPLRHIEQNSHVPMYVTCQRNEAAGVFGGYRVVSMRPMKAAGAIRAIEITSRLPVVHGAPVHLGDPRLIGIEDLAQPDFGEAVEVRRDELPVFWACGVTAQIAIEAARLPFAIAHKPGHMLITDVPNARLAFV